MDRHRHRTQYCRPHCLWQSMRGHPMVAFIPISATLPENITSDGLKERLLF